MSVEPPDIMDAEELNESDRAILEALRDGRATPAALKEWTGLSGQTVHNRLGRLVVAGHVDKVHDSGLYELVDDPEPIVEGYVISLDDEQLDAIANDDVGVIRTEGAQYLVVHADHEGEAIDAVEDADVEVRKQQVIERE